MNNEERMTVQDILMQIQQMDYIDVVGMLTPFVVYYASKKAVNSYALHREQKPKNINMVSLPPELKKEYSNNDISVMVNEEFRESVYKFAEVMVQNFSMNDLTNFYNNIKTLKVSYGEFISEGTTGIYRSDENKIVLDEDQVDISIYHELFHMSSSILKDEITYSGFHQYSPKLGNLGRGINEGYTELLSRRYFVGDSSSYEYQFVIVNKLEELIGKEKMGNLYLNANLFGLIQELKQYSSEEDIMKFISSVDFAHVHLYDKKLKLFEKKMIEDSLKYANEFLIKSYSKKLLQEFHENKITVEQLTEQLSEFTCSLPFDLMIWKNKYNALPDKSISKMFQSIFEKTDIPIAFVAEEDQSEVKK